MTMSPAVIQKRYGKFIGDAFGQLTLVAIASMRGDNNRIYGTFRCSCGNSVERPLSRVVNGKHIGHCGCQTDHGKQRRHGMRYSPEYSSWQAMKWRCLDPNNADYPRWGGRGIGVCQEWVDSFEAFYAHLGPRPKGTTLDRIDGSRGYEPGNVRWATPKQQARNRKDFVIIKTPLGVMPLIDYAAKIGISDGAAHLRLKRGTLDGCHRVCAAGH